MQVFVSWSGSRSKLVGEAIRAWLPKVIQSIKPWMSNEDIEAGSRWLTEISDTLTKSKIGIICVTEENQHNPWLLFEAGALSKTLEQTCVCPILFEMNPGQLSGPLTQFQSNKLTIDGILKVLHTLNNNLGDIKLEASELEEILDVWWPKLEEKLNKIPASDSHIQPRTTNEQLEELLDLSREQLRRENLRLESQKDRENRTDKMMEIMNGFQEKFQNSQVNSKDRMEGMFKNVSNTLQQNLSGEVDVSKQDIDKLMQTLIGSTQDTSQSIPDLGNIMEIMADAKTKDQELINKMMSPEDSLPDKK
jgi:hypothetical protein